MSLPEFSVRQKVLVNVLFFVCLLGGWAAFSRIPVEFFPDVNLNSVDITTIWTGASAEEVERLVTQKLEEELLKVSDIDEIRSVSQANRSEIMIDFDENLSEAGYESALNDVRAAVDRVDDLPADAEEPQYTKIIFSEISPAVMIAVVDVGNVSETTLREVARDVRTRLRDLPGTNQVTIRGEQEREIRVLVDRDAASRYDLGVLDVAERIQRQNLNLPAGTFESERGESVIRARGDYQSVGEILKTVVRESGGNTYVRVGDLARVETGLEKRQYVSRHNGRPALMVSLTKKSEADVLELVAAVDAWLLEYGPQVPEGVELHKTLDTSAFVAPRMRDLVENLFTGILFVLAILWFTIGFRNALLTVVAIPFSFLTAMILFPILGITINSTTLIGMLLVSGMLVDDAIIVLENVYRRVETGEPLRDAVIKGTQEVLWPVVGAVATTCAAFAPLLLVSGTAGKFVSILPKAVIVCLVASLLECLVILPAHYMELGSRRSGAEAKARDVPPGPLGWFLRLAYAIAGFRAGAERGLLGLRDLYARALDVVLAHRFSFGMLIAAILAFTLGAWRHLPVDLFPGEFDTMNVLLEAPAEYSLAQTDRVTRDLEEQMLPFVGQDLIDFSTNVGMSIDSNYDLLTGSNLSILYATMAETQQNKVAPERTVARIRERMDSHREAQPNGIAELRVARQQDGPPVGPPVEARIQSDDWGLSKAIAAEMIEFLRVIPGVHGVEDNLKLGPPEVRLLMDEERASRHGLGFTDLARALRGANDGIVATSYRDPMLNEDIDIRVLLEERYRSDLQDLLDVELRARGGYLLKLRDVADVELTRSFRSYRRYDGERTVSVYAQVDEERATSVGVNQQLQARFADIEERYPEVSVHYGGEFAETEEAFANVRRVFPVAFLAIYMILAALFRSYLQPLIVTVAIPFGFAGVILGVSLLGYNVSFVLFYAAIGLTGVVVNDSLVMVAFINRARAIGMPLLEAVRQSGARRFRPILLTTLTTVVALLPMALGLQGASKTYGPFAASISFGLIVAMLGTLFAVPLAYTSLIVWQDRLRRRLNRTTEQALRAPELRSVSGRGA